MPVDRSKREAAEAKAAGKAEESPPAGETGESSSSEKRAGASSGSRTRKPAQKKS